MFKIKYGFLITSQKAGDYTVRPELTDAHTTMTRLVEHVIPDPPKSDPIGAAAAALLRAARADDALLVAVPGLVKAEADVRAAQAARTALERATAEAVAAWEALAFENLEDVITTSLRPVHDAVVTEARECWPLIANIVTAADAVGANDEAREAFLRFEALSVQYGVVRDVGSRCNDAGDVRVEHQSLARYYTLLRNPSDCWSDFRRLQHQVLAAATPPWHGTSRDRLAWLAAHREAQAWMPTTAELNARVLEVHGADIAEQQRSAAAGRAVQAWGGRAA